MNRWSLQEPHPGVLCLRPTGWGRLRAGASTFIVAALAALAAMLLLFGPDFLMERGDHREGFAGFFAAFLGVGALLVATVAGVMKGFASWRWEFDQRLGVVRLATRTTLGHRFEEELDLARVEDVELTRSASALGSHALALRLDDGSRAVVVRTRTSLPELEALQSQLAAAVTRAA